MAEVSRAELKYLVELQREEIKTLNEVGKLLGSTTDPHELIRLTASYLHRAFPIALCSILVHTQRKLYMIPFAPIAPVEMAGTVRQVRQAASELLHRTLTEEDSLCLVEETPPTTWMPTITLLQSSLFSPITVNDQPIGLLSLFSSRTQAFTKEDHHAVGIVAEQLGAALRNTVLVEELRRADDMKNQFLSIVSHELGTPLTAIKEGVNLILDGALGAVASDQRDFLGTVNENAQRLERLIEKIQAVTTLITGQARFTIEPHDLRTLLGDLEKPSRALAKAKDVNFRFMDSPEPLVWPIDPAHVTAAINEIVENAIHATPRDGLVTLTLSATPLEAQIQIADTGSGIANDVLPTLFERFQSIGGIDNRKTGGLGLGLFIAKSLIEGHGGTITVHSVRGEGTRMIIHLPKQTPASAPPSTAPGRSRTWGLLLLS